MAGDAAMLVVFGGLPGTGKTTVARALALRLGAMHLRIDAIEQAIRAAGVLAGEVGVAGYAVAHALAEANLALGLVVVADCVNPVAESRAGWRAVAQRAGCGIIEVELVCSDQAEHRRRVGSREADIPGLVLPDWDAIRARIYEPWTEPRLVIDTARLGVHEAAECIAQRLEEARAAGDP